ncbi:MAG TPA: DNA polymerase Y family protein [Candidatus Binatia bacterium]|nr:DNA polymerase Y family protein [Candidatus Binatia bacterium]
MFACIYVPDFPVEAMVRAEPLLRERAVAVLDGKPPLARVIALNEKARLLGMEAGMTKLQAGVFAEAAVPTATKQSGQQPGNINIAASPLPRQAVLRQRAPDQEASAHAALLDVAHAFTPRVEDTAADTLLLDLAGMERLYGAPARMAGDLASRVAAVGIEANLAVAANPDAAMHAARGFNGITVIPAGNEARRLGVLPVQVLLDSFEISAQEKNGGKARAREREKLRAQMLDTLERWGVRDFRTLALLPEHALASRLGPVGVKLRRLACGAGTRTLVLCDPPAQFEESMELESPVETIESLSFVLNRLLEQLCARLEARALAIQELRLRLQLEHRVAEEETTTIQELTGSGSHSVVFERALRLPVAMRDAKVFLKLLQLDLSAYLPGAPVVKIWITAGPAPPRSAQRGLFLPISPEAEKLEITLARINAIIGQRRAGIARLLGSHRQGSFRMDRFASATGELNPTEWDSSGEVPMAMRLFRPACRLRVHLSDGRPASLSAETAQHDQQNLQGRVLWSAGPWRLSGDWWTERAMDDGPWDREEWDIALAAGGSSAMGGEGNVALYRIYRDLATGQWFVDASYD